MPKTANPKFLETRNHFISQWGVLGNSWGINRTMSQVHALLMIAPEPLSTQEIMDDLEISRGNANTNLRELVSWGLIKSVIYRGDRKEYFEAEKDVWRIFCIVSRERKRREIDPALQLLRDSKEPSSNPTTPEEKAFHDQIVKLEDFVALTSTVMDKVSKAEQNKIVPKVLKLL